jgi:hypothetical protein
MALTVISFPRRINVGDSIDVEVSLSSYPAGEGWSLKIAVVNSTANQVIEAAASGDIHVISVTSAESSEWAVGSYKWIAFAIKGDLRERISSGDIEVLGDPISGAVDMRSHAEKVLASIEAVIEQKATTDDLSVNIRGKLITRYNHDELIRLRNRYRHEVRQERRNRDRRQGQSGANQKRVRF